MQTCREGKLSNWQSLTMITGLVVPVTKLHHPYSGHMAHDQSLLLYRLFWLKANSQKWPHSQSAGTNRPVNWYLFSWSKTYRNSLTMILGILLIFPDFSMNGKRQTLFFLYFPRFADYIWEPCFFFSSFFFSISLQSEDMHQI